MNNDVRDYFFLKQNFRSTEKGSTGNLKALLVKLMGLELEMWRSRKFSRLILLPKMEVNGKKWMDLNLQ